jgi:hypothetical protein
VLLDRERDRRSAPAPARLPDEARDHPIVCAACGHRITDETYRMAMAGAHEHTFVNPHGIEHHIACFALAPGCAYAGAPESAFSWFPGFTWQVAVCGQCHAHLGWIFRNAGEQFHGLITSALRYQS